MTHALGWILFFVALIASVCLHEAGHLLTAKGFGMKATQYFAGFGPTLWSFQRGETEYGFKAIPAGGFVKIVGMTDLEEIAPEDESRAFYRQKGWKRTIVLAAGSFVHFVIAIFLHLVRPAAGRHLQDHAHPGLGHLREAADDATPATGRCRLRRSRQGSSRATRWCPTTASSSPAGTQFRDAVTAGGVKPATVVFARNGVDKTVVITPATIKDASGVVIVDDKKRPVPKIGVGPHIATTSYNAITAVPLAFSNFGQGVYDTVTGVSQLPSQVAHAFSAGRTAENSPASVVGVGQIAGDAVASGSTAERVAGFLGIVAALNLFVGLFNLLPLLPLDGGHIAILWFEGFRSWLFKVLHRKDPGRVDIVKLTPALYVVLILIVGLSVTLLAADIVNPIANPF